MKRIFKAYKDIIRIMWSESPFLVILTFLCTVVYGLLTPIGIYVNQNILDGGLAVASGTLKFSSYAIYLVLFVFVTLLPELLMGIIFQYVQPNSQLILRTAYRARMLKKLKKMKYEHLEHEESMEIIDKAYNRTENAVRHLFPLFIFWCMAALIASIGSLIYIFEIRWWLLLTVLVPFLVETYVSAKNNYNIYEELETYWKRERKYGVLGGYLKSRNYFKELKAYQIADYLINTYQKRLNERNRDYETYYFKNLRKVLLGSNFTKIGSVLNAILLLVLFAQGQITIGVFVSMTSLMFAEIYWKLTSFASFFRISGFHIKTFEAYDKFFALSEDEEGTEANLPEHYDIEFKDVWFKYPGTEKYILKGLTFKIKNGEKVSLVGENGEGKSTMIKLLLGLFTPDKGEIFIGGKKLTDYPASVRAKVFGPIFQDFPRYSISIKENIGVGNVEEMENLDKIKVAAVKGKVDGFVTLFEKEYDTLLGRDFEGGVDISGGQWQRLAMARAFMGDKPILLLDEPTSQLDPMAEADLYHEFANMVQNKTALFITHRLGSTAITDRIFVIHDGKMKESGTHSELMRLGGIYAKMFDAQKQWYRRNGEEAVYHA